MKSIASVLKISAKAVIATAFLAITATTTIAQQAGCDSTCGSRALRGRPIVPLANQERETPQITNNSTNVTNITQQVTQVVGADQIDTTSAHISSMGCGFPEGAAQWMLSCGSRACSSFGYSSGNVTEYFGGSARLACIP